MSTLPTSILPSLLYKDVDFLLLNPSPLQEDKFQQHQTMHLPLQKLRNFVLTGAFISQTALQQIPGETFLRKTDGRTFKANCSSPRWISSKLPCKNKMEGSAEAFLHHPWGYTWGLIKQRQNGAWSAVSTTKDDSGEVSELKPQKQLLRQPSKVWETGELRIMIYVNLFIYGLNLPSATFPALSISKMLHTTYVSSYRYSALEMALWGHKWRCRPLQKTLHSESELHVLKPLWARLPANERESMEMVKAWPQV